MKLQSNNCFGHQQLITETSSEFAMICLSSKVLIYAMQKQDFLNYIYAKDPCKEYLEQLISQQKQLYSSSERSIKRVSSLSKQLQLKPFFNQSPLKEQSSESSTSLWNDLQQNYFTKATRYSPKNLKSRVIYRKSTMQPEQPEQPIQRTNQKQYTAHFPFIQLQSLSNISESPIKLQFQQNLTKNNSQFPLIQVPFEEDLNNISPNDVSYSLDKKIETENYLPGKQIDQSRWLNLIPEKKVATTIHRSTNSLTNSSQLQSPLLFQQKLQPNQSANDLQTQIKSQLNSPRPVQNKKQFISLFQQKLKQNQSTNDLSEKSSLLSQRLLKQSKCSTQLISQKLSQNQSTNDLSTEIKPTLQSPRILQQSKHKQFSIEKDKIQVYKNSLAKIVNDFPLILKQKLQSFQQFQEIQKLSAPLSERLVDKNLIFTILKQQQFQKKPKNEDNIVFIPNFIKVPKEKQDCNLLKNTKQNLLKKNKREKSLNSPCLIQSQLLTNQTCKLQLKNRKIKNIPII